MHLLVPSLLAGLALANTAALAQTELVGLFSDCQFLVPSEENGGAALTTEQWTGAPAPVDLSNWEHGSLGIGYGGNSEPWLEFLGWDVFGQMRFINASLYVRAPFELSAGDIATFEHLALEVRVDDGFVIHLNGTEVARFNAPEVVAWDSASAAVYPDSFSIRPIPFGLTEHLDLLQEGENVLAIQLLNNSALSQDVFILPELWASETASGSVAHPRHLSILSIGTRSDGLPDAITIAAAVGKIYQLQQSIDLVHWSDFDRPTLARTTTVSIQVPLSLTPRYFRVVEH